MKKLFVIAFALATAPSAFAYYDINNTPSSSEFKLPIWFLIMCVIMIAWGVLEIILFFKVWGMTNNVKKIKNGLAQDERLSDDNIDSKIRLQLLQGDKDSAQRLLITQFGRTIEEIYEKMLYRDIHPDVILKKDITELVQEFETRMQYIGMELPVGITKMKTIEDYYNLYSPDWFTFKIDDYIKIKI